MTTKLEDQYIKARRAGKILNPVPGYDITTAYHISGPWARGYHTGEDHACPIGTPVVAVSWGHVIGAGWGAYPHDWGSPYGNVVLIETATGKYCYGYCHLSRFAVHVGQSVMPGQVVGYSGDTGNTTGPHVHFEARPSGGSYGSDVNPINVKQSGH